MKSGIHSAFKYMNFQGPYSRFSETRCSVGFLVYKFSGPYLKFLKLGVRGSPSRLGLTLGVGSTWPFFRHLKSGVRSTF
jgi:hypothetical protein